MPGISCRIGVEIELYAREKESGRPEPQPLGPEQIKAFADTLVQFYNGKSGKALLRADFEHESHPGHHDSHTSSGHWTVTTDDAIGSPDLLADDDSVWGYPLEFVSPIFKFYPDSAWREGVEDHWNTILLYGEFHIDEDCATHVHVSPEAGKVWSSEQLKRVAQAVIYFDQAFKAIWAPSRREHDLTSSNKANNYKLKDLEFAECCKLIQECVDTDHLVSLMQPLERPGSGNTPLRSYAWNFMNTMKATKEEQQKIGTIEFRCAPGTLTAEHCLIWVEFGASFVQAAAQYGTQDRLEKEYVPTAESLKKFILKAREEEQEEAKETDRLDTLFYGLPESRAEGKGLDKDIKMRQVFDARMEELGA